VTGGWIDIPVDSGIMAAYLARPSAPGPHPAVLVGFEMFGVTGYVRRVADRIAALGYTALVPDFYHRIGDRIELSTDAAGRERGLELLRGVHRDGVVEDVRAALTCLRERGDGERAAMVGLSVGGHIAYYAATEVPLDALAVFYPGWLTESTIPLSQPEPTVTRTPALAASGTRVLFLVGDGDHLFTAAQREEIADRLRSAGVRHELVVYPDTPHGFFCDERETYRPSAADDAWQRVTALLAETLSPSRPAPSPR
jgi:carboxymethylenebutenolidase